MFNALYSREGTNKTKRKNMFDTLSRQFKELLKFPFIHKIRNGSKHYAGRYLDGKAYYYYDERADGRVYEGSFYYLGKYYYHPHGKTTDYVSGTYLHSSKHGRWKFHHKRHGSNKLLYVDYFEGRHNGIYKYKSSGKNGRNGIDNLLLVEMSDGHPCGAINGHFSGEIFTGRCDSEGCPDGTWTMDLSHTPECRIDYEVWDHGHLIESYTIDLTTGTRKSNDNSILAFLRSFVYYECLPMERLITKGSIAWRGNFKTEEEIK